MHGAIRLSPQAQASSCLESIRRKELTSSLGERPEPVKCWLHPFSVGCTPSVLVVPLVSLSPAALSVFCHSQRKKEKKKKRCELS